MSALPVSALLLGLMGGVIFCDLRWMRIPHLLLGAIAVLFALGVLPGLALDALMLRLLAGAVVLALCLGAFAARRLGGGDAKLLPLLVLFVAPGDWALFALCLSLGLIAGLVGVRGMRASGALQGTGWRGITQGDRYPLGPGIGLGMILFITLGPRIAAAVQS